MGITALVSYLCFKDPAKAMRLSLNPYRVMHQKEWYRVLTHGFVHADMTHLLVNMFTFWSFGTYIETTLDYYHRGKFTFFFSISGPCWHRPSTIW